MTKKTVKQMMLVLMVLVVGIYFISGTYARYASTATGTSTAEVAQWAVSLKDSVGGSTDMVEENTFNLKFEEVANANVVDGKIAPTSELVTSLVIDPTGSEVAMDYIIELGKIVDAEGNDLSEKIKIIDIETTDNNAQVTDNSKINGTIKLKNQTEPLSVNEAVTVTVYVQWVDEEVTDGVTDADNVTDTELGVKAPNISMEVKATALQHISTASN